MNKRKLYIGLMRGAMILCTALTTGLVLFLMGYVLVNGIVLHNRHRFII